MVLVQRAVDVRLLDVGLRGTLVQKVIHHRVDRVTIDIQRLPHIGRALLDVLLSAVLLETFLLEGLHVGEVF